jgi:hypothetical protein
MSAAHGESIGVWREGRRSDREERRLERSRAVISFPLEGGKCRALQGDHTHALRSDPRGRISEAVVERSGNADDRAEQRHKEKNDDALRE